MKRKAVTLQLEGEIPQSQSAYDLALEDGYEGSEEQYGKELATIPPTQEQFDAIPGWISKLTTTTEKSDFHHITDSAASKVVEFGMEGKTEQESTSGTNTLDNRAENVLIGKSIAWSGNNSDTFGFTDSPSRAIFTINVNPNSLMSFLNNTTEKYWVIRIVELDENESGQVDHALYGSISYNYKNYSFTTGENTNKLYMIVRLVDDTQTFTESDLLEMNISVGYGNMTEYEPYTNGPSPNPDYPQEIVNAGVYNEESGRYEIECCVGNKNWLSVDINDYEKGAYSATTGEKVGNSTSIRLKELIRVLVDDAIIYVYLESPIEGVSIVIRGYDEKQEFLYNLGTLTSGGTKYIQPDTKYLGVMLFNTDTTLSFNDWQSAFENGLKVYIGSNKDNTEYTPHASQPFTLTSPVPLTKWDYLTKRDGVWGWSIWSYEDFYDGSADEAWRVSNRNSSGVLFIKNTTVAGITGLTTYIGTTVSDRFIERNPQGEIGNYTWVKGGTIRVGLSDDTITTVDEFKTFIAEHPFKILYKTDEEQSFHPLPDEEQELLKNLETYYGVTNLYNDQGCPMWLTYVQDTKIAVDNKFNNIKTALLSLGANI